jgi:hypothetical protein
VQSPPAGIRAKVLPKCVLGAGQKIGLLAFSSFQPGDISDWLAATGQPAALLNQVSEININGGAPLGAGEADVLTGITTILAPVPGAQVAVYNAPFTDPVTSFQTLLNKMIDDRVDVISNTFTIARIRAHRRTRQASRRKILCAGSPPIIQDSRKVREAGPERVGACAEPQPDREVEVTDLARRRDIARLLAWQESTAAREFLPLESQRVYPNRSSSSRRHSLPRWPRPLRWEDRRKF